MSFRNTDYLYSHLPSRFRRDDKDLFLKRYLQFFGDTLDEYDEKFDLFFEHINPDTATEEWIEFWLRELFGWSWFPKWFTLAEKRRLYRNFTRHLARRGTARGIEEWLKDFTIVARVHTRPAFWGEFAWGENVFTTSEPLLVAVEILYVEPRIQTEMSVTGDAAWGESFYSNNEPLFTNAELAALLRYVQPHAQEILLMSKQWSRRFAEYRAISSTLLRTLNAETSTLEDLLDFEATFVKDLIAGRALTGYTLNYTPLRIFNGSTAQLEDTINFINTIVADYRAGNSFANYSLSNFGQHKTVNAFTDDLAEARHLAMTLALRFGATLTT